MTRAFFLLLCILAQFAQGNITILEKNEHHTLNEAGELPYWTMSSYLKIKVNVELEKATGLFRYFNAYEYSEHSKQEVFRVVINGEDVEDEEINVITQESSTGQRNRRFTFYSSRIKKGDVLELFQERENAAGFGNRRLFVTQDEHFLVLKSKLVVDVPEQYLDQFHFESQGLNKAKTSISTSKHEWSYSLVMPYKTNGYTSGFWNTVSGISFGWSQKTWLDAYSLNDFFTEFKECVQDTFGLSTYLEKLSLNGLSDEHKIEKLYRFLQEDIKYAYIDIHHDGYIPSRMADVLKQKKGDCKDYTNILIAALRLLGYEAFAIDIMTQREGQKFNKEFKYIQQFNHMLVQARINNKVYYLDATGGVFGLDDIRSDVQGQPAMLVNDLTNSITPITVPTSDAEYNKIVYSVVARVHENYSLIGDINISYLGTASQDIRQKLLRSPEDTFKEDIIKGYQRAFSGMSISNVVVHTESLFSDSILVTLSFKLDNFVEDLAGLHGFKLNFLNNSSYTKIRSKKRKYNYEFGEPAMELRYAYKLSLPSNYTLDYISDPVKKKSENFSLNFSSKKAKNSLSYSISQIRKSFQIKKEAVDEVRAHYQAFKGLNEDYITFQLK
jgi:hypothetical protein